MSSLPADFLEAVNPETGMPREDAKPPSTPTPEQSPETGAAPPEKTPEASSKPEKPTPTEKPAETAVDWKEVLGKVDKKEAAKFLGFDDFDIDFSDKRKSGVDPYRFLEVKTRDWDKKKDLDVLRYDLKQQYQGLSEEDFDILAEDKLSRYLPEAPEEPDALATDEEKQQYQKDKATYDRKVKLLQIELKAEADKLRSKYKDEDQKFLIPERKADEQAARQLEAEKREQEDLKAFLRNNESAQRMIKEKSIAAGEGEDIYKVPVDAEKVLEFAESDGAFWSLFAKDGEDGQKEIDTDLLYATINYAMNRNNIEKGLIDFGKSLGTKAEADELNQLPKEGQRKPGDEEETLAQAFARRGKDISLK